MVARITFEIHTGVIPIVAAEVVRTCFVSHKLESKNFKRILFGADEVSRAKSDVTDVVGIYHADAFSDQFRPGMRIM
ncbi:hypothetical protein WL88_25965 [Burkholderia diffusa]|uniref:Uncharacterized protein n=1 Tax=Burkholderia diffusa TaxID=488732 RepID=A0AAW3P9B1_9BURK|nr:hypothetical protein WL86_30010 [Burkholderia diffusa]KWF38711.1 hypothetical protein WL85_11150 [Burkholderia diffusa]KWF46756.1 hypothetical protein WL88_25965 [Burkholderia diffusa]KWF50674.1 hypothetical protein WL87_15955 [Burkholderia diffusa]